MSSNRGSQGAGPDPIDDVLPLIEDLSREKVHELGDIAYKSGDFKKVLDEIEEDRGVRPDDSDRETGFKIRLNTENGSKAAEWYVYTNSTEYPESGEDTSGNIYDDLCGVAAIIADGEVIWAGVSFNTFTSIGKILGTDEEYLFTQVIESQDGELFKGEMESTLGRFRTITSKLSARYRCPGCTKFTRVTRYCGQIVAPIAITSLIRIGLTVAMGIDVDDESILAAGTKAIKSGIDVGQQVWGSLPEEIRDEISAEAKQQYRVYTIAAASWIYRKINRRIGIPPSGVDSCTHLGFCP